MLSLSEEATREPCDLRALARGCRLFVAQFARVADAMDASALTALGSLLEELEVLPATKVSSSEGARRMADAVGALSTPTGPTAGSTWRSRWRFSTRRYTFLLG